MHFKVIVFAVILAIRAFLKVFIVFFPCLNLAFIILSILILSFHLAPSEPPILVQICQLYPPIYLCGYLATNGASMILFYGQALPYSTEVVF